MKRNRDAHPNNHIHRNKAELAWRTFFPERGAPVDVRAYDAVCAEAPLQWWYGNAQLRIKGDRSKRFGFFASFFRQCKDDTPHGGSSFLDACTWALIDNAEERYYADGLLDRSSISEIRERIDPQFTGKPAADAENALLEVVSKGTLPRPDRLMKGDAVYTSTPFLISLDNECTLTRADCAGGGFVYTFTHKNPCRDVEVNLSFTTTRGSPILHGEDGVVNEMFYYYFPAMEVCGTVRIGADRYDVEGDGWYDREFGGDHSTRSRDALDAWTWLSLHFSNYSQFSLFHLSDPETGDTRDMVGIFTDARGCRTVCTDVCFTTGTEWTSLVTFMTYPAKFEVAVPSLGLRCSVAPTFSAQEFVTLLVGGYGFYEGCVTGAGELDGAVIAVDGFVECKRGLTDNSTMAMMKRVGTFVTATLHKMYPLQASAEWVQRNVLGRHVSMVAAPPSQKICDTLFAPVRSLIDRGGKSWRSLILVSCCNALSRDYFDCTKYIAMAELLHVGSLIIDDIQDNSVIRRGGKCVHLEHGLAAAINAGTACYFMAPQLAEVHTLPAEKANKIYQLYFNVLRAGHAGQGLDILGLEYLMPAAVETGDTKPLFEALDAIHTYKTGGAAGSVCLMACVLCNADENTSLAMEKFGVTIGLAFQIVDDALNLRGFDGNLKEAGEDIREGKITYPIAKALGKLSLDDREKLWAILKARSSDDAHVSKVVELVNKVGAIKDCLCDARVLVEDSWRALDPLLPDSFSKNMMYTLCKFLTARSS